MENNELYHYGILGMKWGVRRYQNKDGSLTRAGKRRYASEMEKLKKEEAVLKNRESTKRKMDRLSQKRASIEARKAALEDADEKKGKSSADDKSKYKPVSQMTNDELMERSTRLRLEKDYYDSMRNLAAANPPKVSAGKKFINGLVNDVVAPAAKSAGKAWLENFMKEKLGLNAKSGIERLEEQAKKLKATKEIEEYKRDIEKIKKGEPDLADLVTQINNLSVDEYDDLVRASNVLFYKKSIQDGKGVKPDKGKDKKKNDDDDD